MDDVETRIGKLKVDRTAGDAVPANGVTDLDESSNDTSRMSMNALANGLADSLEISRLEAERVSVWLCLLSTIETIVKLWFFLQDNRLAGVNDLFAKIDDLRRVSC